MEYYHRFQRIVIQAPFDNFWTLYQISVFLGASCNVGQFKKYDSFQCRQESNNGRTQRGDSRCIFKTDLIFKLISVCFLETLVKFDKVYSVSKSPVHIFEFFMCLSCKYHV